MVYQGNNSFIVSCSCGCGQSLLFKVHGEYVFVSALKSSFYSCQESKIGRIIDRIKDMSKTKYICDMFLKKIEKEDFLKALYSLKVQDGGFKENNQSYLTLYKDDDFGFGVGLKTKQSKKDVIFGKEYRAYELMLNKDEFVKFRKKCKSYLKD